MKRHWIVTVAILAAMVLATGWALAQDADERPERGDRDRVRRPRGEGAPRDRRAGDRRPGGRMRRPDPLRGLDLTEAQAAKIKQLRKAAAEKIKAINEQLDKDIEAQLTPGQKKKLAQSAEIRKVAMAKMEKAETREERRAIWQQMRKDLDKLLGGPADRPRGRRRPPEDE